MENLSVVVFSWLLSRIFFLSELTCNKIFLFIHHILTLIKHMGLRIQITFWMPVFFPRGAFSLLQFPSCSLPRQISFLLPSFITSSCSFNLLNKLQKFLVAIILWSEKCTIYDWWVFSIMKHNKLFTAPKWLLLLSISKRRGRTPVKVVLGRTDIPVHPRVCKAKSFMWYLSLIQRIDTRQKTGREEDLYEMARGGCCFLVLPIMLVLCVLRWNLSRPLEVGWDALLECTCVCVCTRARA